MKHIKNHIFVCIPLTKLSSAQRTR